MSTLTDIFKELYMDGFDELLKGLQLKDKEMLPEKKFKAGDKVKVIKELFGFNIGDIRILKEYKNDIDSVYIPNDDVIDNGIYLYKFGDAYKKIELYVEKKDKPKKKKAIDTGWGF